MANQKISVFPLIKSIKVDEVIQAADEHGIAMVFTGMRHFKH